MGSPTCMSLPLASLSPRQHRNSLSQVQSPRQSSRRSSWNYNHILTPSGVTPAAATITRPELSRSATMTSAPRASALLSKVASIPGSRRCSPPTSMLSSPMDEKGELQFHEVHHDVNNDDVSPQWEEALRYWDGHEQQGGYISFPSLDNFVQNQDHEDDNSGEPEGSKL